MSVLGLSLAIWSEVTLRRFGVETWLPIPPKRICRTGPYRWLGHPMYLGHQVLLTGVGGLAAGWWGAFGFFYLSGLLLAEWRFREEQ